jgi:hypothetical protein
MFKLILNSFEYAFEKTSVGSHITTTNGQTSINQKHIILWVLWSRSTIAAVDTAFAMICVNTQTPAQIVNDPSIRPSG